MKIRKKNRQKLERIYTTPITNVKQAKAYFREMGCSHYFMARDFLDRYEEYRKLGISEQLEKEWIKGSFDEYHKEILENTEDDLFSDIFNRMYDLFESLKTETELKTLLDVAHFIRDRVRFKDRVIVAETINGRTIREARKGLIYESFDMNHISVAREFVELSFHFSTYTEGKTRSLERCQEATNLCKEIKLELGL